MSLPLFLLLSTILDEESSQNDDHTLNQTLNQCHRERSEGT